MDIILGIVIGIVLTVAYVSYKFLTLNWMQ